MVPDRKPWFRVEAKANDESRADVYIYDEIGESWWGGIGPKALVDEISGLDVDALTVHINSPGGAAWDGITIMNALRAHKARVEVVVDGLCASAASMVAMAGDKIVMNRGSQMMIHDASGGCWGPASLMEETAAILHKLSDSYADVYAARAGGSRERWREAMRAETWYAAEEAVEAGLADEWDGTTEDSAEEAVAAFDLSRFRYSGRAHAPTPILAATCVADEIPASTESGNPNEKEVAMSDTFLAGVAGRLGLTDPEASEDAILVALDEALTAQATPTIPDGAIVVDKAAYAALQGDAAAGRKAMDAIDAGRRDAIIADALGTGRITAASKEAWRAQLDKDEEGIAAIIASMPENTVPVAEIGHSDALTSADDALYGAIYTKREGA